MQGNYPEKKQLLRLLRAKQPNSLAEIAAQLQISTELLLVHIQRLLLDGEEIAGLHHRPGQELVLLDVEKITAKLKAATLQLIGGIDGYLLIDSTNSEAMRRIRSVTAIGNRVIVAEAQSQGKGRRGRVWLSPLGSGICVSLIWSFDSAATALQGLSLVTALSLSNCLQGLGAKDLSLKWPNDVLYENAKLAGILLELQSNPEGGVHVVIGLGLNINMPQEAKQAIDQAVSDMSVCLEKVPDRNVILTLLLEELVTNLGLFAEHGFAFFQSQWNSLDAFIGRQVKVQLGNSVTTGIALGVNSQGALRLKTEQGEQIITGGEVFPSVRLMPQASQEQGRDC